MTQALGMNRGSGDCESTSPNIFPKNKVTIKKSQLQPITENHQKKSSQDESVPTSTSGSVPRRHGEKSYYVRRMMGALKDEKAIRHDEKLQDQGTNESIPQSDYKMSNF